MLAAVAMLGGRPTHDATAVCMNRAHDTVVTGARDGSICVWALKGMDKLPVTAKLEAKLMLMSHTCSIAAMSALDRGPASILTSVDVGGTINVWRLEDGSCLASQSGLLPLVPNVLVDVSCKGRTLLAGCGDSSDVAIFDCKKLRLMALLVGNGDWITGVAVLGQQKTHTDSLSSGPQLDLLTLDRAGVLQRWSPDLGVDPSRIAYHPPCVVARLKTSPTKSLSIGNDGLTVLVLGETDCLVCDLATGSVYRVPTRNREEEKSLDTSSQSTSAAKLELACCGDHAVGPDPSSIAQLRWAVLMPGEEWVAVWDERGCYQSSCVLEDDSSGLRPLADPLFGAALNEQGVVGHVDASLTASSSVDDGNRESKEMGANGSGRMHSGTVVSHIGGSVFSGCITTGWDGWVFGADSNGRVCVWCPVHREKDNGEGAWWTIVPVAIGDLTNDWHEDDALTSNPQMEVTACACRVWRAPCEPLQWDSMDLSGERVYWVCGYSNGSIKCHTLPWAPSHVTLFGHTGAVRSINWPPQRLDPLMLSGGDDWTVRLWDMSYGSLLHVFSCHVSAVTRIIDPPDMDFGQDARFVFCSISTDKSVAICRYGPDAGDNDILHLMQSHPTTVTTLGFDLDRGLIHAQCEDGSVVVWHASLGYQERVLSRAAAALAQVPQAAPPAAGRKAERSLYDTVGVTPASPPQCGVVASILLMNIEQMVRRIASFAPSHGGGAPATPVPGAAETPTSQPSAGEASGLPGVCFAYAAVSYFLVWGAYKPADDGLVRAELALAPPMSGACLAVIGHHNAYAVLLPRAAANGGRMLVSSSVTSSFALSGIMLLKAAARVPMLQAVALHLLGLHSTVIPVTLPGYKDVSLSTLTRYWLESPEDVRRACGAMIVASLDRLEPTALTKLVAHWTTNLAEASQGRTTLDSFTGVQGLATLVLALIASCKPQYLDADTAATVGSALVRAVDGGTSHAALAAYLLGAGATVWAAHLKDREGLFKRLVTVSIKFPRAADSPSLESDIEWATKILASIMPQSFVTAMAVEAARVDKSMDDPHIYALRALKLLIAVMKKYAVIMVPALPLAVDAILRSLDPSQPSLRAACLGVSTTALKEIVKRFPMAAFHQETQRLAVGTTDALVILYDLRTATKWRVLEGHDNAVVAVAFDQAGSCLASYSAIEGRVRYWQAGSSGAFGMFGTTGRCLRQFNVPHTQNMDGTTDEAGVPYLLSFRIQLAPDAILLHRGQATIGAFSL